MTNSKHGLEPNSVGTAPFSFTRDGAERQLIGRAWARDT